MRRNRMIQAAAVLGLLLAATTPMGPLAAVPAGAQASGTSVSFTPATVPVHGTIEISATCPFSGGNAAATISVSVAGMVPAVEAYGFPLIEDGNLEVQLPLRSGAPGAFDVGLACFSGGPETSTKARAPGLTLTEPALPRATLPTVDAPRRVAQGDPLPVTGTCPPTDPAADRVVIRDTVRSGEGAEEPAFTDAPVDAGGSVAVELEPRHPDNPAVHTVDLFCLAGDRFLNRGVSTAYQVIPAAASTTTSQPSSTSVTTTTVDQQGSAPGAVAVTGSPSYTG